MHDQGTIRAAHADELPAAFALAFQHLPADLRQRRVLNALTLVASGELSAEGVFVAAAEDKMHGVFVATHLAGAGGLVWPPQSQPRSPEVEDRLVAAGLRWLQRGGAKLAQALLSAEETGLEDALRRGGFRCVTQLRYMQHDLATLPVRVPTLRLETYDRVDKELFRITLERTYVGSLDCPEVDRVRSTQEVIEGHLAQGRFRPDRWWLAWRGPDPVGVALAIEVPDGGVWDLSYLGVTPEARGQGVGRELGTHVLHAAREAHANAVILAVDVRNRPALQLYGSLGFESLEIRDVYLILFDTPLAGCCG